MALELCKFKPCHICGTTKADPHHVKSKKSGGHDIERNLVPLCRKHHSEVHTIGLVTFADKYERFKDWLVNNGWQFDEFLKKWIYNE
jgi:Putative HNHc nuclease